DVVSVVPTAITDPATGGQVVLVAATDPDTSDGDRGGIYRSADGGKSFRHLSGTPSNLPLGSATFLVQDPGNADQFYAAFPGFGVFRSGGGGESGGQTWQAVNNNLSGLTRLPDSLRIELAVHNNAAAHTNAVYAAVVAHPTTALAAAAAKGAKTI